MPTKALSQMYTLLLLINLELLTIIILWFENYSDQILDFANKRVHIIKDQNRFKHFLIYKIYECSPSDQKHQR